MKSQKNCQMSWKRQRIPEYLKSSGHLLPFEFEILILMSHFALFQKTCWRRCLKTSGHLIGKLIRIATFAHCHFQSLAHLGQHILS